MSQAELHPIDTSLTPAPGAGMGPMYTALAKAQGAFKPIEKNRAVTIRPKEKATYSFRYADLQEIREKTTPALSENGICLFQLVTDEGGMTVVRTILGHSSGAQIEAVIRVPRGDGDIKNFGATVTYLRRYVVTALLGVAADDDLDEDGDPDRGDGQSPVSAEVHAGMRDAKTIGELSTVMSRLNPEDKRRYGDYFNQRSAEIRGVAQC